MGCTTACRKRQPYGFTWSKSCPIRMRRCDSCGPPYISYENAPLRTSLTTLAVAFVAILEVRGPPASVTSLKGVLVGYDRIPKTKYLFLIATQLSGPASRVFSPGSRLPNRTLRA